MTIKKSHEVHWQHCSGDLTKWLRSAEGKPVLLVSSEVQTCVVTCEISSRRWYTVSCRITSLFQTPGEKPAKLRMRDEKERVDPCEEAKAKVEERLYRVTVIERILASKGKKILGKGSPLKTKLWCDRNARGGACGAWVWALVPPTSFAWGRGCNCGEHLSVEIWTQNLSICMYRRHCSAGSRDIRLRSPPWSLSLAFASLASIGSSSSSMMSISNH